MRKFNIYLSALILLLFVFACATGKKVTGSDTKVYPLGDTSSVVDGSIIYALPMTVFNIAVDVERVKNLPGPYARYASDMLGLKDVIMSENENWSITGIRVSSGEEIDPSEYYVIESTGTVLANALKLKHNGLILDINPAAYSGTGRDYTAGNSSLKGIHFRDLGSDEYFVSQNDTVYRTVKLDTAFVKIPYLVEKKKILGEEQLAEKAAKSILELRDGKHSILSGEANLFPQSNAGIDEINRMEKEYMELFTGKSVSEKKTYYFTLVPSREDAGKGVSLFKFSENSGISTLASATGAQVIAEIIPMKKAKDITVVPRSIKEGENAVSYDKLYYRLPDVATLKIRINDRLLFEGRRLVYQYGNVMQLPANYIIGND